MELKDVRLPQQLQRAMAAEAEATREARAKVIAADGEQKASRALKEASDIMSESPSALQLRYLQTLVRDLQQQHDFLHDVTCPFSDPHISREELDYSVPSAHRPAAEPCHEQTAAPCSSSRVS